MNHLMFLRKRSRLFVICLVCWLLGVILSISLYYSTAARNLNIPKVQASTAFSGNKDLAKSDSSERAYKIFLHNGFVALLICIGGFITAGALSVLVLMYNGFMVTSVIITGILSGNNLSYFIDNYLKHGIFEMAAFFWFGVIGLSGFFAWKSFLNAEKIEVKFFFAVRNVVFPVILLAIAAIIESN